MAVVPPAGRGVWAAGPVRPMTHASATADAVESTILKRAVCTSPGTRFKADTRAGGGIILMQTGRSAEAMRVLETAVARHPDERERKLASNAQLSTLTLSSELRLRVES
jgi:hypothetical protein